MSIESYDPRITQEADPFFIISRKVVQEIDDPVAGFIWVYLRSMSSTWKVIKSHIENHFGLSQDKVEKVFAWLTAHKLLEYKRDRRPDGTLGIVEIVVRNGRDYFKPENVQKSTKKSIKSKVATTSGNTTPVDNHTSGFLVTNINKQSNKDLTKQRVRKNASPRTAPSSSPKKSYCPDWLCSADVQGPAYGEEAKKIAKDKNLDLDKTWCAFSAYAKSNGWLRTDWKSAFVKWLIDERTISSPKHVLSLVSTKSTVPEYGPGHPHWELQQEMKRVHQENKRTARK